MSCPTPMQMTELVQALSARTGFAGLTPTTRSREFSPGRTSRVIEELIEVLRKEQALRGY